jgi:hypothetical protein
VSKRRRYNTHWARNSPIAARIEQLYAPDLVEDRVVRVVSHVVRRDRRERVALEREDAALEEDEVVVCEERGGRGERGGGVAGGWLAGCDGDEV